jgi:hypothetical protein
MMEMQSQAEHDSACNEEESPGIGARRSLHTAVSTTTKMEESSRVRVVLPTTTATTTAAPEDAQEQNQPQKEEEAQTHQPRREYTISFFPRDQAAWVRTLMTSMLGLLLFGLVLSLLVMPQYALVIILFWLLIMSAFFGLACLLQQELQRKDFGRGGGGAGGGGYVFHPILHAMAQAVVDEMEALQDEWRQEILLIKAENASTSPYASVDKNGEPVRMATSSRQHSAPFPQPKKKSKLFRIFVKPFLRGGRNSNNNNSSKRNNSSKASPTAAAIPVSVGGGGGGDYVAPPPVSALV